MVEPYINIETRDFELTNDGDLKIVSEKETDFQDFWGDFVVDKGNDQFDELYGVPWTDISQFGRIEATMKLIESYLLEKAEGIEILQFDISEQYPSYKFIVKYRLDEGEQTLIIPVNQ